MTVSLVTVLFFILNSAVMALDLKEIECKATVSWQERTTTGTSWRTEGESDIQTKRLTDDSFSSFVTLQGKVIGNNEQLSYSLSVDRKRLLALLRVDGATLSMPLMPGEEMGWSRGNPNGGADKQVTCRRGGLRVAPIAHRTACKSIEVISSPKIGRTPAIIKHDYQDLKITSDSPSATQFGLSGPQIATSFDKGVASFWLGEISEHLVDVFNFSVGEGKRFGIRKTRGGHSYWDVACQVD